VSLLCETLSASRSAYYAWRQDELGPRRREDNRLMPLIRSVFWEHRRRYGARRIAVELAARNEPCGRADRRRTGGSQRALRPATRRPADGTDGPGGHPTPVVQTTYDRQPTHTWQC